MPKLIPPPDDPNGIAGAEAAVDEALPNPPNDGAGKDKQSTTAAGGGNGNEPPPPDRGSAKGDHSGTGSGPNSIAKRILGPTK